MANEKRLVDAYSLTIHLGKKNAKRPLQYDDVLAVIADEKTVDAVEVVHGRWVDEYKNQFASHKYICSVCGKRAHSDDWRWDLSPYCPNCGAKMDK